MRYGDGMVYVKWMDTKINGYKDQWGSPKFEERIRTLKRFFVDLGEEYTEHGGLCRGIKDFCGTGYVWEQGKNTDKKMCVQVRKAHGQKVICVQARKGYG